MLIFDHIVYDLLLHRTRQQVISKINFIELYHTRLIDTRYKFPKFHTQG